MNADKALDMLAIFSTGFACGLEHRYECYQNYQDMLYQYSPREKAQDNVDKMWKVVLEFEKGLAGSTEEADALHFYTLEELWDDMEEWYTAKRREKNFNQNVLY